MPKNIYLKLASLSRGWVGLLLALVSGALVTLSLAPFDIWPLGIISCALLALLLNSCNPRQAVLKGWFYGLGLFGCGSSWVYVSIHVYGYAPVPLAVLLTLLFSAGLAIFSSLTCYVYVRYLRDKPLGKTLVFAAIWVLGEWWRGWFLTGFPWLYLGYAHIDSTLAGWAPVTGVLGVSFVVVYSGAVISNCLQSKTLHKTQLSAIALIWLVAAALNTVDWVTPKLSQAHSVAMVQANIPQQIKWRRDQYQSTLALYEQLSKPLWSKYDLIIWPEAAIPDYYQRAAPFLHRIGQQASSNGASLITGIPYHYPANNEQPGRYYNSVMAFGKGDGLYHKQRLVPFGEYVPLENLLRGLIQFFDLPMSAFSSGSANQKGISAGGMTIAPFICYEIAYADLVGQWLPQSDILLTISNDAWFGNSIGPKQHLQIAQMRALESGRYLLRATGTGISAIVNQRGQIIVRGGQFQREVISGQVIPFTGSTPFAITGSWPVLLFSLLICIGSGLFAAKIRD